LYVEVEEHWIGLRLQDPTLQKSWVGHRDTRQGPQTTTKTSYTICYQHNPI